MQCCAFFSLFYKSLKVLASDHLQYEPVDDLAGEYADPGTDPQQPSDIRDQVKHRHSLAGLILCKYYRTLPAVVCDTEQGQVCLPPELRVGLAGRVLRAAAVGQAVLAGGVSVHRVQRSGEVPVLERATNIVGLQTGHL